MLVVEFVIICCVFCFICVFVFGVFVGEDVCGCVFVFGRYCGVICCVW